MRPSYQGQRWAFHPLGSSDETAEACDINRWLTGDIDPPLVARARSAAYQSVDCLEDVAKVEKLMVDDPYWGKS